MQDSNLDMYQLKRADAATARAQHDQTFFRPSAATGWRERGLLLAGCRPIDFVLGPFDHQFDHPNSIVSGWDGSGAVHTVLPWEAFGGHVPSGGSEMYWFDQSIPIHLF